MLLLALILLRDLDLSNEDPEDFNRSKMNSNHFGYIFTKSRLSIRLQIVVYRYVTRIYRKYHKEMINLMETYE